MDEASEVITLCPFDIHFSQTRIRPEFQDGRSLQTALDQMQAEPLARTDEGDGELLLVPPFPRIEVTKWRCKLRDSTGAPKLDSDTGCELYSQEERWFSFDNRRLCCLQRAAAAQWPKKVMCEAIEIPQTLARTRELRKFDTRSSGCSVFVGRRDEPNPERWCWRTTVGLPAAEPEPGVVMRLRHRGDRAREAEPGDLPFKRGQRQRPAEESDDKGSAMEVLRGLLLFMIIYLVMRIVVILWQKYHHKILQSAQELVVEPGAGENSTF
mmetsp:Transcript_22751/g.52632  ORF Transcript_22751/g.52632 Transcript_22751/m.52632 type:complete len:268 (+) Transcript_22751:82-885(+)